LAFATSSKLVVWLAFWIGVVVIALTALLLMQILLLRVLMIVRERRDRRFILTWRPLMAQSLVELPAEVPKIPPRQWMRFLFLWNHFQGTLRGGARGQMNRLARRAGMHHAALHLLNRGKTRERLAAMRALSYLGELRAWEYLLEFASHSDPLFSLAAAQALVRIDARSAIATLMPAIVSRTDWSPTAVASLLREAGPDAISGPLAGAVWHAPAEHRPRLIRYLGLAHMKSASEVVHRLLASPQDQEVIAACLLTARSPDDLPLIRAHLHHPAWPVRVQAVAALGRIGDSHDVEHLSGALSDREWWVRYRAAQALAGLPFVDLGQLRRIHGALKDRYARDILFQVIAEHEKQ
jgi:hypothetical protein